MELKMISWLNRWRSTSDLWPSLKHRHQHTHTGSIWNKLVRQRHAGEQRANEDKRAKREIHLAAAMESLLDGVVKKLLEKKRKCSIHSSIHLSVRRVISGAVKRLFNTHILWSNNDRERWTNANIKSNKAKERRAQRWANHLHLCGS